MKNKSDEKEDTEVLLKYKNSGSKRLSPQVPNENKRKMTESPKGKAENERKKRELNFHVKNVISSVNLMLPSIHMKRHIP